MTKPPNLSRFPNCIAVPKGATVLWWDGETLQACVQWDSEAPQTTWMLLDEMPNDSAIPFRDAWTRYLKEYHTCKDNRCVGPCWHAKEGIYLAVLISATCEHCSGVGTLHQPDLPSCQECDGVGKTSRTEIRRGKPIGLGPKMSLHKARAGSSMKQLIRGFFVLDPNAAALFFYDDAQQLDSGEAARQSASTKGAARPDGVMVTREMASNDQT